MAKKTNNNSVSGGRNSSARKVEIIGISLIAIAVLIGLCILSYTPEDYQYLQTLTVTDIYKPDASARMIQNWLGGLDEKGHFSNSATQILSQNKTSCICLCLFDI